MLTMEELKAKLKSAADHQQMLEEDFLERQRLRSQAERITPSYSEVTRKKSGKKRDGKIITLVEYDDIIRQDMQLLVESLNSVRQIINYAGNPRLHLILQMRYLNYKTWEQIAVEMNYSIQHIYRLRDKALKMVTPPTAA